jgi:hypothetical protein
MLIARDGYESRSYVVATEDGYLLHMNRIVPRGPGNHHPVLLQHGMLSSSADWLIPGPERSLGNAPKIKQMNLFLNFFLPQPTCCLKRDTMFGLETPEETPSQERT